MCECVWVNKKKGRETERQIQKKGKGGQPLFQSSVMSISVSRNQHCLGVYWSRESQLHSRDQNPNYLTIFTLWNSGGTSKKLAQRIEYWTFKLPLFGEFCCYTRQFFHDICKIPIADSKTYWINISLTQQQTSHIKYVYNVSSFLFYLKNKPEGIKCPIWSSGEIAS